MQFKCKLKYLNFLHTISFVTFLIVFDLDYRNCVNSYQCFFFGALRFRNCSFLNYTTIFVKLQTANFLTTQQFLQSYKLFSFRYNTVFNINLAQSWFHFKRQFCSFFAIKSFRKSWNHNNDATFFHSQGRLNSCSGSTGTG